MRRLWLYAVIVLALVIGGIYIITEGNVFAVVNPNTNVQPGDTVVFDAREYMDCGRCITPIMPIIDGYRIKIFNPNGNLMTDYWNPNYELPGGTLALRCGEYANINYEYVVPQNAAEGRWIINVEVVVDTPYQGNCEVAEDQGTFTVGTSCVNKDQELKYCIDENTRYYKPANSCQVTYTTCDDEQGTGWKCLDGECQHVEICGDGHCDDFENQINCPEDCTECGDNFCTGDETPQNCPQDCFECGDGICDDWEWFYCGVDCANCGDGNCYSYEKPGEAYYCKDDCGGGGGNGCEWWDIFCHISSFFKKLWESLTEAIKAFLAPFFYVAIAVGVLGTILISRDKLRKYLKGKELIGVSVFLGIMVGILIYYYLIFGIVVFLIYMLVSRFISSRR